MSNARARAAARCDRLVHVAEPVIGPAEGVDDVTVVGTLLDRAFDHAHALVEIDALVSLCRSTSISACSRQCSKRTKRKAIAIIISGV